MAYCHPPVSDGIAQANLCVKIATLRIEHIQIADYSVDIL